MVLKDHTKFQPDWSNCVGEDQVHTDRPTNRQINRLKIIHDFVNEMSEQIRRAILELLNCLLEVLGTRAGNDME